MTQRAPKVGIIQLHIPEGSHLADQYDRAVSYIKQAAEKDADIIILPEMFLGLHHGDGESKDLFAAENYKFVQKLQVLAKVTSPHENQVEKRKLEH
jgi:predicted amidohydrolase